MAYTPGLGRTPRIVATRLGSATLAAAGTLSLARWWPFGSAPGEDADLTLIVAGFGVVALALALPRTTEGWPVRAIETSDAVVIPARRLTMLDPLVLALVPSARGRLRCRQRGRGPTRLVPRHLGGGGRDLRVRRHVSGGAAAVAAAHQVAEG
ncbi:hypothetical protein H483_0113985 [Dietzia sp. UCD-THP]|uniref:hypothetical protein n=1 Tax=Dietzia sp. UCD-THP TaxID=1292020 RepID=UPI000362BB1D|nr:hypothetical protein [Dietzia sp. UCD-THP]EYT58787.1 hypothetical protein H483_0113985 [Dietzia sp. UCD-THP]